MNYQQSLHNVLSDPSFQPPECLLDLNLKGDFKDLLKSCEKKARVKFYVNEVKLVLPIFEAQCPNDDRPREAILAIEQWLRDPTLAAAHHAAVAAKAAYATSAADYATTCASNAARAASSAAASAVYYDDIMD